jgi:hypothetical protein
MTGLWGCVGGSVSVVRASVGNKNGGELTLGSSSRVIFLLISDDGASVGAASNFSSVVMLLLLAAFEE